MTTIEDLLKTNVRSFVRNAPKPNPPEINPYSDAKQKEIIKKAYDFLQIITPDDVRTAMSQSIENNLTYAMSSSPRIILFANVFNVNPDDSITISPENTPLTDLNVTSDLSNDEWQQMRGGLKGDLTQLFAQLTSNQIQLAIESAFSNIEVVDVKLDNITVISDEAYFTSEITLRSDDLLKYCCKHEKGHNLYRENGQWVED